MIMYKLEQNKDKSPTFASCHAPARTLCPDTPRAAWATCDDPTEWLQGQPRKVTYILSSWGDRRGSPGLLLK